PRPGTSAWPVSGAVGGVRRHGGFRISARWALARLMASVCSRRSLAVSSRSPSKFLARSRVSLPAERVGLSCSATRFARNRPRSAATRNVGECKSPPADELLESRLEARTNTDEQTLIYVYSCFAVLNCALRSGRAAERSEPRSGGPQRRGEAVGLLGALHRPFQNQAPQSGHRAGAGTLALLAHRELAGRQVLQ